MKSANVKRAPTGHRVGDSHPRAKYSDETVQRARSLREMGRSYGQIGVELGVPWRTVADWVNFATRYRA